RYKEPGRGQNRGGRFSRKAATPSRYSGPAVITSISSFERSTDALGSALRRSSTIWRFVAATAAGEAVVASRWAYERAAASVASPSASTSFHKPQSAVSAPVTTRPESNRSLARVRPTRRGRIQLRPYSAGNPSAGAAV